MKVYVVEYLDTTHSVHSSFEKAERVVKELLEESVIPESYIGKRSGVKWWVYANDKLVIAEHELDEV